VLTYCIGAPRFGSVGLHRESKGLKRIYFLRSMHCETAGSVIEWIWVRVHHSKSDGESN